MDFKIIYEDNDILVADKPSGMAVHPSKLHQGDTLADEVRTYLRKSEVENETENATEDDPECDDDPKEKFIFRCLTRLDKDTSGLVLIAKTLEAAQNLNRQMADKKIVRIYEAIVEDDGSMPGHGTIEAPIARLSDDEHDIRRCVSENGERAVTHYEVVSREGGVATVKCTLETGRTHQIRVHMAHIGHPIVGDRLYNPEYSEEADKDDTEDISDDTGKNAGDELASASRPGMGLKMVRLEFNHPCTGKRMLLTLN